MYAPAETREESWVDETEPFSYLTGLVQDTLIDYVEVKDDSWMGFHVEQVWKRSSDLSVIEIFFNFSNLPMVCE